MNEQLIDENAMLAALDWKKDYADKYGFLPDSAFMKIHFNRMVIIHHREFENVATLSLTEEELKMAEERGYLNDTDEQWMNKEDSDD